jgi:hypothetical protein
MRFASAVLGVLGLVACGGPEPTSPPPKMESAPPPPSPTIEIANTCDKDVTFHFGPQPIAGSGKESTLAPHMTTTIPRGEDPSLYVWLQNKGGIAKVAVTRRMRIVEIGKSCWTLDAHE